MRMDPNQNFGETTLIATGTNNTSFKKLKFPYNDELSLRFTQEFYHFNLTNKYIHHFWCDQI